MENLNNGQSLEKKGKKDLLRISQTIIVVLLIVSIGLFAVNQTLLYIYKSQLLQKPCDLCIKLNPQVENCIYQKLASYPDGLGGWTDPSNRSVYNITIP